MKYGKDLLLWADWAFCFSCDVLISMIAPPLSHEAIRDTNAYFLVFCDSWREWEEFKSKVAIS
jgi:hypothetical protein